MTEWRRCGGCFRLAYPRFYARAPGVEGVHPVTLNKEVDQEREKWAQDDKDPAKSWDNQFRVQQDLDDLAVSIAKTLDANSFLYQARAVQLFVSGDEPTLDAGLAKVKAKLLIMPSQSDLLVYPKYSQEAAQHLKNLERRSNIMKFLVMAVTTTASIISILSATRSRNF